MTILLTGGNGYIGSHTYVSLIESGHKVVIADNFYNSKRENLIALEKITGEKPDFYPVDVTRYVEMRILFEKYAFDGVIHFAGYKAVGESVAKPLEYYANNLTSTINLLKLCREYGVKKFVFSSSATVYGENTVPFDEDLKLLPTTNPYGETKAMSERIMTDFAAANPDYCLSILRYFNPVGAHESGLIGEDPMGIPNNLMPFIAKVAHKDLPELSVFGNDYSTPDGTGVRDYIHVVDLAEGHVAALEKIKPGTHIYNLGTGKGTSVLELVNSFKEVNKINVPYKIVDRRPGDIAECYAKAEKAKKELQWTAKRSVEEMCRDTWRFITLNDQE